MEESLRALYMDRLNFTRERDVAAGMTLTGPHRDDVRFGLDEFPASGFASRAQQRTIALSLRLAETKFLEAQRGEPPVLLLDDILSEMDASRRITVMSSIGEAEQVIVTGTGLESFPESFRAAAKLFAVERGSVRALESAQAPA
jgi:DNA replication and repair protein RecF